MRQKGLVHGCLADEKEIAVAGCQKGGRQARFRGTGQSMGVQLEHIEKIHFLLIGLAAGLAWLSGWMGPGSVVLGGGVMAANLWLLKQIARRLLTPAASQRPGVVLLLVLAKFSIFLALLGLLFWRVPLDPMAFAAGATLLMIACVTVALASPTGATARARQAQGQG